MNPLRTTHYARFVATGCLLLVFCVTASAGIQAYMGDVIPLGGNSYGSPTVYLFLTGPNLPANGVALDNINARADQGHFTTVDVDSNDHWSYKWGTNSIGGRLDAGTYTIWVSNSPNDRSRLLPDDYSTISVTLGAPSITVLTPADPRTLMLNATPVEASVVINGAYRGSTPLILDGIDPGTYTVTFSHFGYRKFSTSVKVESGKMTEVTATLVPETGSIAVNSSPAGARVLLDGVPIGIAPVTLTNIAVGNHTLSLENEGFKPFEQPVHVSTDQITVTEVTLVPVSAHPTLPAGNPGIFTGILITCGVSISLVIFNRPRSR
jgi:hypothetical protein